MLAYVTCPSGDEASRIGRLVVEAKLAACANLISGMTSIYAWQGAIETASECVLLLKTTTSRVPELQKRVLELHPYENPCFVAWPIASGSPDFLNWIQKESQP